MTEYEYELEQEDRQTKIGLLKRLHTGDITVGDMKDILNFKASHGVIMFQDRHGEYNLYSVCNILYSKEEFENLLSISGQTLEKTFVIGIGKWLGLDFGWNRHVHTFYSKETEAMYEEGADKLREEAARKHVQLQQEARNRCLGFIN